MFVTMKATRGRARRRATRSWPRRGARCPSLPPVAEGGVVPTHMVRRAPHRALQQVADPVLQDVVGGQPARVLVVFGLQELVGVGKGGIGAEVAAEATLP